MDEAEVGQEVIVEALHPAEERSIPDTFSIQAPLREYRQRGFWPAGLMLNEGVLSALPDRDFLDTVTALTEKNITADNIRYIGEIITRLQTMLEDPRNTADATQYTGEIHIKFRVCVAVNELLRAFNAHPECVVPPEIINRLYALSENNHEEVKHAGMLFWNKLMPLDKRNKEDQFNLEEKIYQRIEAALHSLETVSREELGLMLRFVDNIPSRLTNLIYNALGETTNDEAILTIFSAWSNKVSLPYARMLLRTFARSHDWDQQKLDNIDRVLRINEGTVAFKTLPDLYKTIDFGKDYQPNAELQEFEGDLLNMQLHESKRVLDVGCGDGRLMKELKSKGRHVVGIDIVKESLEKAKKSGEDVVMASWHETPFADNTFDGIYCLGRSFLHNITEIDQLRMLLEMNRIMQLGSRLIMDLPNPDEGDYAHERERMDNQSRDMGIWNVSKGFINDGPDLEHRFDRNVPDDELMYQLAETCGFRIQRVASHEYEGAQHKNENIYWRLTKVRALHPYMLDLLTEINEKSRGVH
ncbi:MAG: hypothetical protein RI947_1591 [Candidatus Parcubacteria bacterium]|jgi:SAM-dependent methyltransferase